MSSSASTGPRRRVHDFFALQDIAEELGRPPELVERDFTLVTIAARLVGDYGDALCFKGGFVLRHAYGHERFSKDIDATRRQSPKHKFDADEVAQSVRSASMRNLVEIEPGEARTDSRNSLDFDQISYQGPLGKGVVALEVSYREAVSEEPDRVEIGPPYYDPFEIPVMALDEIVAEKLRTLCQRQRPTDLSDLAMIFERQSDRLDDKKIASLARAKFEIVRDGNRMERIEQNIETMGSAYDSAVPAVAPDAPDYASARKLVLPRIRPLVP